MNNWFNNFATRMGSLLGRSSVFVLSSVLIVVWAVLGPLTAFSDTWQLWANTATTIITFLAVFIIQNTQNRNSSSQQIKLDLLLLLAGLDDDDVRQLESLDDKQLEAILEEVQRGRGKAHKTAKKVRKTSH